MVRTALLALAAVTAMLSSAPAWACHCDAADQACQAKGPAAHAGKPGKVKATSASQQRAAPAAGEAVEDALAGKCSCESASDCTCKKGDCKCPKCKSGVQRVRMIESVKGERRPLVVPERARRDATAGVFI